MITRHDLAILLEDEGYPAAADAIRFGRRDPIPVLNELRPFVPFYNEDGSRDAIATFQQVIAGELEVSVVSD